MRLGVVRDLVRHTRCEPKCSTVLKLGVELAIKAKQDMSLLAPVICEIAR